jgi:antitoxin HigA-1
MLSVLQDMEHVEELRALPHWKAHRLTGDRAGTWALHVTANWRLTFRVEDEALVEENYEDYDGKPDARMKNPPHPGSFIRTEILEPLGLSVTAAAKALGVSRVALSSLLNGQVDLSGDIALQIEKAFGIRTETLRSLRSFDELSVQA